MNHTKVVEILLLGFQNPKSLKYFLFVLFLVLYILTLLGNLLIIILVAKFQRLQSPMYFFLTQLSVCDILLTTNIVPNLLHVIINGGSTISLAGCITQFYFFCVTETTECFLLTMMSYDRYLAICRPLHYTSIMSFRLCFQLILSSWLLACIPTFTFAPMVSVIQFCGHVIDHYFCDFAPLLELACTKHTVIKIADFVSGVPFVAAPVIFIAFTYVSILITIRKITSSTGRQKAFSTCSSHLTVVCSFYGTVIAVYLTPSKGESFDTNKVLSLLYTVLCPFFNPIIYTLRNQDIKSLLNKFIVIRKK
ncbi:olfactory receptor 476-like [Spea bombifrons]|uniref:olfactory receptor 476-like n=1 Tax=Spea bombifrons TaxID=233779 RepID=UPI00234BABF3|nr:olfactory receptor 476-like [Spea bombifrons]